MTATKAEQAGSVWAERWVVCGLCGAAFVLITPPDEAETERDTLCGECLTLPPAPDGPA